MKRDPNHRSVSESTDRALERRYKRRLERWSPTVHWGLLARGRLDGVICYRPDREEQCLGELFAAESGLRTERGENWFIGGANDAVFDSLRTVVSDAVPQ